MSMVIVWSLYTFMAFAPGGNITGLQKTLHSYDSRIECETELKKDLAKRVKDYPTATHIYGVCIPEAGHYLSWMDHGQ